MLVASTSGGLYLNGETVVDLPTLVSGLATKVDAKSLVELLRSKANSSTVSAQIEALRTETARNVSSLRAGGRGEAVDESHFTALLASVKANLVGRVDDEVRARQEALQVLDAKISAADGLCLCAHEWSAGCLAALLPAWRWPTALMSAQGVSWRN